jgi:hypothetical protein
MSLTVIDGIFPALQVILAVFPRKRAMLALGCIGALPRFSGELMHRPAFCRAGKLIRIESWSRC